MLVKFSIRLLLKQIISKKATRDGQIENRKPFTQIGLSTPFKGMHVYLDAYQS